MCGLAGIILQHKSRTRDEMSLVTAGFERMLKSANTRGGHATGFALIDNQGNHSIHKKNVDAYNFLSMYHTRATLDSLRIDDVLIMGHTRYATKGSPKINSNNHPIRTGHTIGTHNGWVRNDDELFDKFDLDRFAQVDSEVIFRMYDNANSVDDFVDNRLSLIQGKLCIVWTDLERPEYVYIIKANNPLEMVYIPSLNAIAYGSTSKIVKAGFRSNVKPIEVKANTMLRINTNTLSIRKTTIEIAERKTYFNTCSVDYGHTISNFVPRYSWNDKQRNLFKKINSSDGSKIKVKK